MNLLEMFKRESKSKGINLSDAFIDINHNLQKKLEKDIKDGVVPPDTVMKPVILDEYNKQDELFGTTRDRESDLELWYRVQLVYVKLSERLAVQYEEVHIEGKPSGYLKGYYILPNQNKRVMFDMSKKGLEMSSYNILKTTVTFCHKMGYKEEQESIEHIGKLLKERIRANLDVTDSYTRFLMGGLN